MDVGMISPRRFVEYEYYSVFDDREMIRVSAFDEHGAEFWMLTPAFPRSTTRRVARDSVRDAIDLAIRLHRPQGEVLSEELIHG